MATHYVGITDFYNLREVAKMLQVWKAHAHDLDTKLHVGVMVSYKTLNSLPTKWAAVWPGNHQIRGIFQSPEAMNCLHYADYTNTDVSRSLARAIDYGGPQLHALQLDMVWPSPDQVERALRWTGKSPEVILQIGSEAMRVLADDPVRVVEYLSGYQGLITHVLLDKSMGQGKGLSAEVLWPYVETIHERYPELGIAVAGGLGPDSSDLAAPLLREFPFLSVDAQSRLRSSGSALDPIEWGRAAAYLRSMFELMREAKLGRL